MKFLWCTLAVKNMDAAVKFYRDVVGLPVSRRFAAGEGMEICFLGDNETKVELICGPKHPASGQGIGICFGFEVKSVDEMLEFVQEQEIEVAGGPFQPNPRIKFFYIKDPDGYSVQFVENM